MKLVIMTKSTFFVEEDKILAALFEQGMDNLHLYKPGSSPMYAERLLTLLPDDFYKNITVHDHFYLQQEYNLAGIHLDNNDTPLPAKYKGRIGRTCCRLDELKEMKRNSNYVFLDNTFAPTAGNDDTTAFTTAQLEDAADRGLIDKKVYAMGGVTLDNLHLAKELGFGGVVVSDDIWNKFEIHSQNDYKEVINHFVRIKKTIS